MCAALFVNTRILSTGHIVLTLRVSLVVGDDLCSKKSTAPRFVLVALTPAPQRRHMLDTLGISIKLPADLRRQR